MEVCAGADEEQDNQEKGLELENAEHIGVSALVLAVWSSIYSASNHKMMWLMIDPQALVDIYR
jgi:hypothetical protein